MKKKTNLLPSNPQVYEAVSTEQEIYETENCFQLKVEDNANVIQQIAEETGKEEGEIVDLLFTKLKEYRLREILDKKIDDNDYNVSVKIIERWGARSAHVKISKRSVREKIREGIKSFFSEHVG